MAETVINVELRGDNWKAFTSTEPECLLVGAAGTGKSRACLEKVHYILQKNPGARALLVRKTFQSLKGAGLVTFRDEVLHPSDDVKFHNGNNLIPPEFIYPNGSVALVGGMDDPMKVMSQQYDIIYVQEATDLAPDDWDALSIRLRNYKVRLKSGKPFVQLLGDCNPNAPNHWLKRRCDEGRIEMLTSIHENNPLYFDAQGRITDEGRLYIAGLDRRTGVMYRRYRLGEWAAADGRVYDSWDAQVNIVDRFEIPQDWIKFRSIDFGYVSPFVCQWWALSPDDKMYLYREIYMSGRVVDDHAQRIHEMTGAERIDFTVADHDAEGRATLNKSKIRTSPAKKPQITGIQEMEDRIRADENGEHRLFVMRDSLVDFDENMRKQGRPTCFAEEIESYTWMSDGMTGRKMVKEKPVDFNDHAMDAARYAVMAVSTRRRRFVSPISITKTSLWRGMQLQTR